MDGRFTDATHRDAQRATYRRDASRLYNATHNVQRTDAMHRVSTIEPTNIYGNY